ncbi:MAG: GNAT family N-acetyltransferase [Bellilinea sp.]|jgi:ribosomal protein S18 acetylase RimI-like enzyme
MRNDLSLRPANEQDFDFLWQVHCAALKPYIQQTWGWDEEFQKRYLREHFNPQHSQIIRYMGAEVGMLSVEETSLGIVLSKIEVLPEYQGLGIGTTLIRELLERAVTRGLPVSLRVLKINPACQLYLRLGFSVVGETDTHFWMRSEGAPRAFLPERWETQACFLHLADERSLDQLTLIMSENQEVLRESGQTLPPDQQALQTLRHNALPPGGVAWRESIYLIRDLESRDTVGYLAVYFGHPAPDSIYIGSLYLRPVFQGRGFGREIVSSLEQRARAIGFREARVKVGLKNWRALRFWTSCGYSRITRIRGERENGASKPTMVELQKSLISNGCRQEETKP